MIAPLIPFPTPTDATSLPLLLTTPEAASVLRLAPKTLRNWVGDPECRLRPVKVGSRTLYRRDDVLAFAGLAA